MREYFKSALMGVAIGLLAIVSSHLYELSAEFANNNDIKIREKVENQYGMILQQKREELGQLEKEFKLLSKKHKEKKKILVTKIEEKETLDILLNELAVAINKKEAFAIAFSESRFRRNIIHPSNPDRVVGMGGVDLVFWEKKLIDRGIDPKGLLAIDFIYNEYLTRTSNEKRALEFYKGTIKNRFSYNLTKAFINVLKDNKSFDLMLETHLKSESFLSRL